MREILNGEIHMDGNYSFVVAEKAEQIHQTVITKIAENKQSDTLGNT